MLDYTIVPISVIEASTSPEPDDISRVNIRIECKATAAVSLQRIDFIVKTAPIDSTDATIRKAALTTSPKSVTPVAEDFRKWTFAFLSERSANEAIFRASPQVPGHVDLTAGEKVTFILRDVEVIDQDGETGIGVEELELDQTAPSILSEQKAPKLRKIDPNLRIDRFTATPPIATAGSPVVLSWGTTGAAKIEMVNAKLPGQPTDTTLRDSQITVNPATTTTYTLTASAGGAAEVRQQLTVTVSDQLAAPKLVIGNLPAGRKLQSGAASVEGALFAGSASFGGPLTVGAADAPSSLAVNGTSSFTGDVTVPSLTVNGPLTISGELKAATGALTVRGGLTLADGNLSATIAATSRILGLRCHLTFLEGRSRPEAETLAFPVSGGVLLIFVYGVIRLQRAGNLLVRLSLLDASGTEVDFFNVRHSARPKRDEDDDLDQLPTIVWPTKKTASGTLKLKATASTRDDFGAFVFFTDTPVVVLELPIDAREPHARN